MANISTSALGIKPLAKRNYFDAIKVRTRRDLTLVERRFLRKHAHFAGVHRGRYIPGFSLGVLTVVAPEVAALQFIAELPGAIINRLEIAVDVIVDAETKWMLRGVFDEHFVQPWHRTKVQCRLEGGSYSSQTDAPLKFIWYADRPSKVTGEVDCFHVEGRHIGVQAVRRAGIEHPRDLLAFDHEAYWAKHLNLFEIDLERLGRLHLNRQRRERRRHPLLHEMHCGSVYNFDRATGNALFRVLALHPKQPNPQQAHRSVQCFVDRYGRGPFLREHPCALSLFV